MRLLQFEINDRRGVGIEVEEQIFDTGYASMLDLIRDGDRGLERAWAATRSGPSIQTAHVVAPITNPGKILGSGVNYRSHGDEEPGFVFPDEPVWDFIKVATSIVGPGDDIVIPPTDDVIRRIPGHPAKFSEAGFAVDYEVELGVVIGRTAKNVRRDQAFDYVFGYTVFNDVGARSLQFHNGQRDLGKNFDTFCPVGPVIVTRDELPDVANVVIRSFVNGELRQEARVGEQIAPPDVAIEWISSIMTLAPGDCLMTGTPAGCGTFMNPPRFLEPGDTVTCSADGIGELINGVVAGTARITDA